MSAKPQISVDYLFIGLGAANCLLLTRMSENGLLQNRKIAVIEPESKNVNDRTFCFWATQDELIRLRLEDLVCSSWKYIKVNGKEKQSINPLNYYHIKGIDLYNKAKNILHNEDTCFHATTYNNHPVIHSNSFEIHLNDVVIIASQVFDSRPPKFSIPQKNQSHLFQSFIGWEIVSSTAVFDTSTMVMMDFDIPQNDFCQFMYILPFTENTALIEITRFGTEKIQKEEAEIILKNYIQDLGVNYQITDKEQGVIPMSTATIESINYGPNWVTTGAKANMIKPSTGYAFHAMAQDALEHTEAMKNNSPYVRNTSSSRFQFYDRLLLKILEKSPQHGKTIFQQLFNHVSIKDVLRFLSEKSTIGKEVFIFSKLPIGIFMKAAIKDTIHIASAIPPSIASFLITIIALILFVNHYAGLFWIVLIAGFLTIGLSHGAVDHLTAQKIKNKKQFIGFIVSYLIKGGLLGVIWFLLPDLALVAFILYSAWHFGQADFIEWRLKQGMLSFLWGIAVLLTILFFHLDETVSVLKHVPGLEIWRTLEALTPNQVLYSKIGITTFSLALTAYNQSKLMAITLLYLLISSMLPLLASFGIYFVGQHSFHGWRHLTVTLNTNSYQLWLKSLPFSIAGAILISFFMLVNIGDYLGVFFILLSCISIPHVLSMHQFYSKDR